MKKVFTNSQIFSAYAAQNQDYGRNGQGNIYFEGNTLFSYGKHYVMAVIHGKIALVNNTRSSVTTNKHRSQVTWELTGQYNIIHVNDPAANSAAEHQRNIDAMQDEIIELLGREKRARKESYKSMHRQAANDIRQRMHNYREFLLVKAGIQLKQQQEKIAA